MEKNKTWIRVMAIFGFIIAAINGIYAFADAGGTGFFQVQIALIIVALLLVSLKLADDVKEAASVIGAACLYFFSLLIRTFIFILDSVGGRIVFLKQKNIQLNLDHVFADAGETRNSLLKQKIDLYKMIDYDSFGLFLDNITIVIAALVIVIASIMIIQILRKKEYTNTFYGRFTLWVMEKTKSDKKAKEYNSDLIEGFETENEAK